MTKKRESISNKHMCDLVEVRGELRKANLRIDELEKYLNKACNHLERLSPKESEKLINMIRSIL